MGKIYIAANLERLRKHYSLKQDEIAAEIGISRQAYSNYERGIRVPDLETTARLAEFYHVTVDCLVWAEDPVHYWENMKQYSAGVLTNAGQVFPLNDRGSRMVQLYLGCSEDGKREIEFYVEVKDKYEKMKNGK